MKKPIILSLVLGVWLGINTQASADNIAFQNMNNEQGQHSQHFVNIRQLRGIIDHPDNNPIIGAEFVKHPALQSKARLNHHVEQMVALSREPTAPLIDTVVTGQSNRSMLFQKFDSNGLPMNHHQEYAKPNAKSLASSIWDAIDLNPYPGE